jgi:hypothetical protein
MLQGKIVDELFLVMSMVQAKRFVGVLWRWAYRQGMLAQQGFKD